MAKPKNQILAESEAIQIVEDLKALGEQARAERESKFTEFFSFALDGEQWETDEIPDGESPQLTFNQTQDLIEVHESKIFPINQNKGIMEIGVKSYEKAKKEEYEKEILEAYSENEIIITITEQLQNFLYGGAGCLYFPQDPITKKVKIISIDPTKVYMNWEGNKLSQFAFKDEISIAESKINKKNNWLERLIRSALGPIEEYSDRFKKVERITYWDKDYQIVSFAGKYAKVSKNEPGIIPASWIPNRPKPHQHEGKSDVKDLKELDKEYNFRTSDLGQRVHDNTEPLLATFSASEVIIERDEKGHLPLGQDDDAKFLTFSEDMEILKYTQNLSEKMQIKMGINDAVLGKIKSNVSALAMSYFFAPMLDKISKKRIYWDKALRDLNKAILTYKFKTGNFKTDPLYQSAMAVDEDAKIKNTRSMLDAKLISYLDAIDEVRSVENATEKLNEIKEETKELSKIDNFLTKKTENTNIIDNQ
jgi:hypothetical protein